MCHTLIATIVYLVTRPCGKVSVGYDFMNKKSERLIRIEKANWLISSVQFSSVTQSCPTLCDPMNCSTPGLPVYHQLLEFTQLMSIKLVMPSSYLILCRPLLLLPSIFPSSRDYEKIRNLKSDGLLYCKTEGLNQVTLIY